MSIPFYFIDYREQDEHDNINLNTVLIGLYPGIYYLGKVYI